MKAPPGMTILCMIKIINTTGDNKIIPKKAAILSKACFMKMEKLLIDFKIVICFLLTKIGVEKKEIEKCEEHDSHLALKDGLK